MQSPTAMFPKLTALNERVKRSKGGYDPANFTCGCDYLPPGGGSCENCDLAPAIAAAAEEMPLLRGFPTHPYYYLLLSSVEEIRKHPRAGNSDNVARAYLAVQNAQLKADAKRAAGLAAIAAADAAAAAWVAFDAAAAAGGGGAIAPQV